MITPTIILYGAIALAVVGVLAWFYMAGRAKEKERVEAERQRAVVVSREIDDAIAGRDPASNREELGKWAKG